MKADCSFASDNASGVHPAIMEAIARANRGAALAYGHDECTARAVARFRAAFGEGVEVFMVFNGTAANVLGLRAVTDSHHAVICARSAHLWRDECNAPERFIGAKLVPVECPDGKLTPERVRPALRGFGVVHQAQPRVISVSQPTEWGTVYTVAELRSLAGLAREHGMLLHVDGARLANAAVALDVPLGALGADAGVDVMSFGGTKLGLLGADAVILFERAATVAPGAAERAGFYRKQGMQLASKMRFLAAQLDAMLDGDLWRELAGHGNAMAARLGAGLAAIAGVELAQPVESNGVFARLPAAAVAPLQEEVYFHVWDPDPRGGQDPVARLMAAWDTEAELVDRFVAAAGRLIG